MYRDNFLNLISLMIDQFTLMFKKLTTQD